MTQHHHIRVQIAPGTDPAKAVISGKVKHSNALQEQCESILSTYESGKQAEARKAYHALKQQYPRATLVRQLQALILYHDGRFTQAYQVIREILKETPNNAGRLNFQGLIQRQLGMFDEAVESYRKAIALKPDFADPYNNLAIIHRYYGEIDKAIENFRKAISIKPDYPAAIYNLSCMKAYQLSDEEIAITKALLSKAGNNDDKARCCFSLYNTYLDRQEHQKAFTYLRHGNDLIHRQLPVKKPLSTYVREVKDIFTPQFYENRIRLRPQEKQPVFIVGMPRSGSSLLEQMLASHSQIFGLGESRSMPELLLSIDRRAESNLESGESTIIRVNIVDENGTAVTEGAIVAFSSPCSASGLATFSETPVSTTTGQAQTEYTAFGCSGTDQITATLIENGATATVTLTIAPNQALSVIFDSATKSLVQIGGQDTSELTFKVLGAGGVPVIGGDVSFAIGSGPVGATILPGRETATTDNLGRARTVIRSGTVQGPVSVIATHDASGIEGTSADIIISTGVVDAAFFSLSSNGNNPAGAFNTDAVEVTFFIIASDQFGNNPRDGTRVSFVSPEAGNITNSCELQDGVCSVTWRSSETRPSNMRVEIIAYTSGAENFPDTNGNAVFDAGDGVGIFWSDLPEQYADENENGAYDLGEYFVDLDADGVRDAANGEWDGPCLSAVDASAVCTGLDSVNIAKTSTIVMSTNSARLFSTGTFGAPGTTIGITQGTSGSRSGIVIADSNTLADALGGNPMPLGTTITFSIQGGGVSLIGNTSWTVGSTTAPTGTYGVSYNAAAAALPADLPSPQPSLVLSVTAPSGDVTEFIWPFNVTL